MEVVLDDWLQEAVDKGIEKGIIDTARNLGAPKETIVMQLMTQMGWTAKKANAALKEYDKTDKIEV